MNILSFLPIIIIASGFYLLIKLRFFFIIHPIRTFGLLKKSVAKKGALSALCLSLAGTLGVGNIVGVAFGISVGGAGSVFWLLISSVFSLVIKFSEATLSSDMKTSNSCGMTSLIEKSFCGRLKILAPIYAALCLFLSLTMGSALQARAAVESFAGSLNSYIIPAFLFAFLIAIAVLGGTERIEKLTVFIIPFATLLYIFLCVSVIIVNIDKLPEVFKSIISDAFSADSALGGIGGGFLITKMREGFSRGLLSNEAGAGTSAFAHTRNADESPVSVGIVGMCEVFFDTVVLCMLTAVCVLIAVPNPENYSSGIEIIKDALRILGSYSLPLLSISVFAFAYSTVICWYYYGRCALQYLSLRGKKTFAFVFVLSVFSGALLQSGYLILISDYVLFFLTLISLATVIKNSDRLIFLSEKYELLQKTNS